MEEPLVRFYCAEILLALSHIHHMGMIYRDLKPQNVILNTDGHIKIVDLGGAEELLEKPDEEAETKETDALFSDNTHRNGGRWEASFSVALSSYGKRKKSRAELEKPRFAIGRAASTPKSPKDKEGESKGASASKSAQDSFQSESVIAADLRRSVEVAGTLGFMAPEMLYMIHQSRSSRGGLFACRSFTVSRRDCC